MKVIVTGGLGVLGAAVAAAFEAAGAPVAVIDRAASPADPHPRRAYISGVDLTSPAAARHAFDQAAAIIGGADALINVAGGFTYQAVAEAHPDVWDRMFALNFKTCANMCQAAIAGLSDGGAIVNVAANAIRSPSPGMAPYGVSKAGVAWLTESMAAELGGRIRVNAVLPGIIDTPANRADMPAADRSGWTAPEAIAEVIVFLASPAARAINGALVPVVAGTDR